MTGSAPPSASAPPPPLALPRAALFDWDNTLVDSWGCIHDSLNATFVAMGKEPWSPEETKARVRRSLRDSFPLVFGDQWEKARAIYYDHFSAHHIQRLAPMAGAAELLETLHRRGVYLALVSNKTGRFLREEVAALGWQSWFGAVVGAADTPADKPALPPVALALAPSGLALGHFAAHEVWFVGDADIDLECAHAAGCLPLLINAEPDAAQGPFAPAHHFPSCAALSAAFSRASGGQGFHP